MKHLQDRAEANRLIAESLAAALTHVRTAQKVAQDAGLLHNLRRVAVEIEVAQLAAAARAKAEGGAA